MTAATTGQRPDGTIEVPWASQPDHQCFGCSPHNASGLRLRFEEDEDGGLRTRLRLARIHESYPGVVHGGIVSTVCDEIMGNLVVLRYGTPAFTTALRIRYLSPLAVDRDYVCVARLRADKGGPETVHAVAEVLDATGEVMATASAGYRCVDMDRAREHIRMTDPDAAALTERLAAERTTDPSTDLTNTLHRTER
ncbi:PaaI family thioesterase [Streptomyces coeruleoprunus]|uniref:PaaI family thioesterase n=1 Tax=Streptomyces coeruleoprunus TaxID=285563 RepID=A0ABV9XGR0_9ACTN